MDGLPPSGSGRCGSGHRDPPADLLSPARRALASRAEQAGPAWSSLLSIKVMRARCSTFWMAASSCPLRCCSCSSRCGQRRRSARTTSSPAAPAPTTRSGLAPLGSSLSRKGNRSFQGLDGDSFGARSTYGSHIQAEPVEVECRSLTKVQIFCV